MIGAWVRSSKDFAQVTALYKEDDDIHVEGNLFCDDDSSPEEEVALIPEGLEPVPLTAKLLEMNGWVKKTTSPVVYVLPLLGDSNKVVFDNVPHYHDIEVLYVHHLQTFWRLQTSITSILTCRDFASNSNNQTYF